MPLGRPKRIWAMSSIHAESQKLVQVHDQILERFRPGDRLIYTGNYIGRGRDSAGVIDELLMFRRLLLSMPGVLCNDIVYLRGAQEELWQKALQVQFAPNPKEVMRWMLDNGLNESLCAYGVSPIEGMSAANGGVMPLSRWTNRMREMIRVKPGHDIFMMQLRRAAYTNTDVNFPMIFVNSGINQQKSLDDQGDAFWWYGHQFPQIVLPFEPFQKIIRGYDPLQNGITVSAVTASIDGGCGFGGNLVCAGFDTNGNIFDMVEA
jgi:hypothetical protein